MFRLEIYIYKGLIRRLELTDFEYGENFFVAFYDWRHPNAQSASEYLAPIIAKAKEHSASGQVDIVAHSMGGLLVQQYIASDQYAPGEIDQFIMLGTPNSGASDAYLPWEGGVLPTTWDRPTSFYVKQVDASLNSITKLNLKPPLSYRHFFPSLKELLPTENFLLKDGADVAGNEQNDFLFALHDAYNNLFNTFGITVTTIAGNDEQILEAIALNSSRTSEDVALERWRDGHPIQEIPTPNSSAGNATVLTASALLGQNDIVLNNVSHTKLPEAAQDEVLQALGVADTHPKQFIYEEPKWLTGFVVLSPIDIVITDSSGKTVSKNTNDFGDDAFVDTSQDDSPADLASDDPKIIILRNLPPGTYTVRLTGTNTGAYTVIVTHTDDATSTSETLTGNTTLGKQEFFTVKIGNEGEAVVVSEISPLGGTGGGHIRGDESDCCPGHDTDNVQKKKGKVLGATTKKVKKLGPLR